MNKDKQVKLSDELLKQVSGGNPLDKMECPIARTSLKCPDDCSHPNIRDGLDASYYCPFF